MDTDQPIVTMSIDAMAEGYQALVHVVTENAQLKNLVQQYKTALAEAQTMKEDANERKPISKR